MRRYALYAIVVGCIGLLLSWAVVACVTFVQDAFDTNLLFGVCSLSGVLLLCGGILYLCVSELTGYLSVRKIDALADALQSNDLEKAKKRTTCWLISIHQMEQVENVHSAGSIEELHTYIHPVVQSIDASVDIHIAKEAALTGAVVGISPWAMIDAVVVAWRQLRLLKTIAKQYGVRPSYIGTFALCKSVVFSVAFADASEHLLQWISAKVPSIGGLLPSAGQAVATAVLTARLGRSCKAACRPVKKTKQKTRFSLGQLRRFIKTNLLQYRLHESHSPAAGRTDAQTADL